MNPRPIDEFGLNSMKLLNFLIFVIKIGYLKLNLAGLKLKFINFG